MQKKLNSNIIKMAVIGNPIVHSLSPQVWQNFAGQFNINIEYNRILAEDINDFKSQIIKFFDSNGTALNITSPFKHEAFKISDSHSSIANFCQTSNFIQKLNINKDQYKLHAASTDGIGLVRDIELNCNSLITNKRILIIGSGFVLDSILINLFAQDPFSIDILARNKDRISYLINKYGIKEWANNNISYDIIINTIPNQIKHDMFQRITEINDKTLCYDMTYSSTNNTNFLAAMSQINPNVILKNGLGMLVEQAGVAFNYLFSLNPNTKKTISDLYQII